jgi:4a-hydroxytetrahydrobiopterin dehydratase
MSSMFPRKDWRGVPRRALSPTEVVTRLAYVQGWELVGNGADVAIEKIFRFANYHETLAFVNAVAFIAHTQDHHPELTVGYNRCAVRWNTHDVRGLSRLDFEAATQTDALLPA